jgi:hypothetical protein
LRYGKCICGRNLFWAGWNEQHGVLVPVREHSDGGNFPTVINIPGLEDVKV